MTLVRIQQAVELSGRNGSVIQRAMREGKLPFTLDSAGRRVIDPADLDRWNSATPRHDVIKIKRTLSQAIADYIGRCDDALQTALERRDGQYPDWLILPFASKSSATRAALAHWLDEMRAKSGKTIRVYFEEQDATSPQGAEGNRET